jgi:succinate dehydrogenase / fumarate reductase, membrane anchor subunit
MRYLTDRKRAEGKGAAHHGTGHHWSMQVSSVGLAFLVPAFIFVVGRALGGSHEDVLRIFSNPIAAILTALTLIVGARHFAMGATMMIEDYSRGTARKVLVILAILLSWMIAATGLFAIARIAL